MSYTPPKSSGEKPNLAVTQTLEEHQAIVRAQQRLEAALTKGGTGRPRVWAQNVAVEMKLLYEELQRHVESAEGPDGLLSEMEKRMLAINERVVNVLKEHRRL